MKFYVLTLFPEMIMGGLNHSMLKRAVSGGLIELNCVNIRDFAGNKHNQVDDAPYGGGPGMVICAQPVYDAFQSLGCEEGIKVIYMTPHGRTFNQAIARELSSEKKLVLLCGHYEGIDQRVIDEIVTDEISLGDFIMTGGELAAMAVIDGVSRLLPGVLGKEESCQDESFSGALLEYPQYTRPSHCLGRSVPEVLLSGHHENIKKWRQEQAMEITRKKRPDLLTQVH